MSLELLLICDQEINEVVENKFNREEYNLNVSSSFRIHWQQLSNKTGSNNRLGRYIVPRSSTKKSIPHIFHTAQGNGDSNNRGVSKKNRFF